MPKIRQTLPDINESVFRPVILEAVKQIREITNLPKEARMFFPGESEVSPTPGSEIESNHDKTAIFDSDRYIKIEVTKDYDLDQIYATSVNKGASEPIFHDPNLNISINPLYTPTDVSIQVTYSCPNKTEALRWRNDIRLKLAQRRNINIHTFSYSYCLPPEMWWIIKQVYVNREAYLGYNESLVEYIRKYTTNRLNLLSTLTGNQAELSISERTTRIQGYFESEDIPSKPEKDNDKGIWNISFTYKFTYDEPYACFMEYPIIVHNDLLPEEMVNFTDSSIDLNKEILSFQGSLKALRYFESENLLSKVYDPNSYIKIPYYDDYLVNQIPQGTGIVFTALCCLDPNINLRYLLNLKSDLDPIVIDLDILKFIEESEYPYIGKLFTSILNISLYKNEDLLYTDILTCDNQLNISSRYDLDPRQQYRVMLGVQKDISYLRNEAWTRLMKYPKAFVKIFSSINPFLQNDKGFQSISNQSSVTSLQVKIIQNFLNGNLTADMFIGASAKALLNLWELDARWLAQYLNQTSGMKTVMVTNILSYRLD
jgi:hypothetical protein